MTTVRSGWCQNGNHGYCTGTYDAHQCPCSCHAGDPDADLVAALTEAIDKAHRDTKGMPYWAAITHTAKVAVRVVREADA